MMMMVETRKIISTYIVKSDKNERAQIATKRVRGEVCLSVTLTEITTLTDDFEDKNKKTE